MTTVLGYDERKGVKMKACTGAVLLACSLLCGSYQPQLRGQSVQTAPPIPKPDDQYKADILLVVAHPDDDTGVSNYITRASLDQHKRVAVVFTTRGNSGSNALGMEQAKAMADEREMEARTSVSGKRHQQHLVPAWFRYANPGRASFAGNVGAWGSAG